LFEACSFKLIAILHVAGHFAGKQLTNNVNALAFEPFVRLLGEKGKVR